MVAGLYHRFGTSVICPMVSAFQLRCIASFLKDQFILIDLKLDSHLGQV